LSLEAALLVDDLCSKIKTIDEVVKILYNKELIDTDIIDIVIVVFAMADPDDVETTVDTLLENFDTKGSSLSREVVSEIEIEEDTEEEYKDLSTAWVRPA
jgi:hypothetical protein